MMNKKVNEEDRAKLKALKLPLNVVSCPACERIYRDKKKAYENEWPSGKIYLDCHVCGDLLTRGAWQLVDIPNWEKWEIV
jgi:uncharacterized C2H2 Zn-finger protein